MSEGTWVGPAAEEPAMRDQLGERIFLDREAGKVTLNAVHYSPCDEGCRHGDDHGRYTDGVVRSRIVRVPPDESYEASWRQVDARRLSWDSDLRPEQTAVLCLRCLAVRA